MASTTPSIELSISALSYNTKGLFPPSSKLILIPVPAVHLLKIWPTYDKVEIFQAKITWQCTIKLQDRSLKIIINDIH